MAGKSKKKHLEKGVITKISTCHCVTFSILTIITAYIIWKYIYVQGELKAIKSEENSSWMYMISKLWKSKNNEDGKTAQVFPKLWNSITDDFHFVKQGIGDFISGQLNSAISIIIQVICGIMLLIIVVYLCFFWKTSKQNKPLKKNSQNGDTFNPHPQPLQLSVKSVVGILTVLALIISIPIEYMRQYQEQVAIKFALIKGGVPRECYPQEMSMTETLKHWINWELSWSHEPCEKYHKAVMVDPWWETSPLQVLWSVIVKGILHPIELFFSSTGKSFKLFFTEIPAFWQPWMFIFIVVVVIIVAVMSCNYRVYVPFVGGIEPKTPQSVRTVSRTGEGDKSCKPCNAICDKERGDT